jgi:ceramide glucosyltransferase
MTTTLMIILMFSFSMIMVYTFYTVRYRGGEHSPKYPVGTYPLVSVLKPLKNLDDEIDKNLESLFLLDYPKYEILLGVDSMSDPIISIIREIQDRYPSIPSRIIETGHDSLRNPKIHKLAMMANEAEGSLFWASDSNIRAERDTLTRLVDEYLTTGSKIIFSPIRATGSNSIGSIIENAYFNHFLSGNVIAAWSLFKKQIIVGKSMLVERDTLNRFGGFSYFNDYLAEDYMMGETYEQSSYPISSNFTWVHTVNQTTTIKGFFARVERWAKLRFHLKLHFYLLEIFLNPLVFAAILGLWQGGGKGLAIFGGTVLLKLLLEYINFFVINREDRRKPFVVLLYPFCILLKDILLIAVYFSPFFSSTIKWRGGRVTIGKNTQISLGQESLLLKGS